MGKNTEQLGDSLTGFREDLELGDIQSFIKDPLAQAAAMVGDASARIVYDLDRFRRCSEPPFAATIAREMHVLDTYYRAIPPNVPQPFQISFLYSDGFGRELQTKVRAEDGDAPKCGPDQAVLAGDPPTATGDVRPGDLVRNPNRDVVRVPAAPRWVGTGRTVYNNKIGRASCRKEWSVRCVVDVV